MCHVTAVSLYPNPKCITQEQVLGKLLNGWLVSCFPYLQNGGDGGGTHRDAGKIYLFICVVSEM